jgi:hypothetical protein
MAIHKFTEIVHYPARNARDLQDGAIRNYTVPARDVPVEIEIDTAVIARFLAGKAAKKKSKRAVEIGGAVVVRLVAP